MISVQNRLPEPGKENRVSITPDNGSAVEGVLAYADDATQEGTFWNRKTAQLLQGDIRTYPVREGQSISAGDVVNVGAASDGAPDTIYKDVVPQDNVENVVLSSSVSDTSICKINDLYSILVFNNGAAILVSNETGASVSSGSYGGSFAMTNPSICALSTAKAAVTYERTGNPFIDIIRISGSSMSFAGEKGTIWENAENGIVLCLSSTKLLYIANNGGLGVKIITVSGTTANYSASPVMLPNNTGANYISACRLPDEGGNKRVCICFSDTGDGNKGKAVIATIDSSNAVTFGDVVTLLSESCNSTSCSFSNNILYALFSKRIYALTLDLSVLGSKQFRYQDPISMNAIIVPVDNGVVGMHGIPGTGGAQLFTWSDSAITEGNSYSWNSYGMSYLSGCGIENNKIIVAYATDSNDYGRTTILTVNGNQIAGSFLDNSQDAIALESGTGGDTIKIGYGGYCECPGVTEGQQITSDGVSAFSPLDGWLSITDARNKALVTGEYTGTHETTWSIDVGFKPSVLLIQQNGPISGAGSQGSNYIMFVDGVSYGAPFSNVYGVTYVTFTDTGVSFNSDTFNNQNYKYYYAAWR